MVLANAGLGTRLRPLTHEMPKPMVPVLNRPIMDHILELLKRHGFEELIANLSYLPDQLRERFGDGSAYSVSLEWSFEEKLLGTAGRVRNVREFFGFSPFPGDGGGRAHRRGPRRAARGARVERRDRDADREAGRRPEREYGVVVTGSNGRVQGFQEKPDPAEALSNLASCMIYMLEPEDLRLLPRRAGGRLRAGRVPRAAGERRAVPRPRNQRVLERRRFAG